MAEEIFTPVIPKSCREKLFTDSLTGMQALINHGFRGCGTSVTSAPYTITRKHPATHAVIYTKGGSGWLQAGGQTFSLEPGTVTVLPANVDHKYGAVDSWEILWFHMSTLAPWNHLVPGTPRVLDASQFSRLDVIGGEFVVEMETADSAEVYDGFASMFGTFVRRELMGAAPESQDPCHRALLDRLWSIVAEKPDHPWTIHSLAKEARVSRSYLHLLVKRIYGMSAMEKVAKLRMHRAKELLHDPSKKVATIAEEVGYDSPYSFSRAFKRCSGLSPGQYRAQERRVRG